MVFLFSSLRVGSTWQWMHDDLGSTIKLKRIISLVLVLLVKRVWLFESVPPSDESSSGYPCTKHGGNCYTMYNSSSLTFEK